MRHLIALAFAILISSIQIVRAKELVAALEATQASDSCAATEALAEQLWGIAAAAHVRIGFESIEQIAASPRPLRETAALSAPIGEVIDVALASDNRYEWRLISNIIVVRPKEAWADLANPLNRPIGNAKVNGSVPAAVLEGLSDFLYAGRFGVKSHLMGADPVSFQVSSGTVLDVLNQLVIVSDHTMWLAYYRRSPTCEAGSRSGLILELRNSMRLTALTASPKTLPPYR